MIRYDCHTHTRASFDCRTDWEQYVDAVIAGGLTGVAVTDHDTIEGALRVRDSRPPFEVIMGCEFTLDTGAHLIGLYIERPIRPGTIRETIAAIHEQGGIAVLPHPFRPVTGALALLPEVGEWEAILREVDAIEAFNAKSTWHENQRSLALAHELGIPVTAGSDAHRGAEIGAAYLEQSPSTSGASFGRIYGIDQASPAFSARQQSRERLRFGALRLKRAIPEPLWRAGKRAWTNWLDHNDRSRKTPCRGYGQFPVVRALARQGFTEVTSGEYHD